MKESAVQGLSFSMPSQTLDDDVHGAAIPVCETCASHVDLTHIGGTAGLTACRGPRTVDLPSTERAGTVLRLFSVLFVLT
jgi:hypothetical protein